MTNDFFIEYWEDEEQTLLMKLSSSHIPRSDDDVTINEKHYKVYKVEHVLQSEDVQVAKERFIVTVHKKKIKFGFP
ncbi:hypothetical protein OAS49_04235 [Nitrosopumilus sp.]|jgi:hypothetical protein|nr:hypothetical protein [Nitrosopumilus sp.]